MANKVQVIVEVVAAKNSSATKNLLADIEKESIATNQRIAKNRTDLARQVEKESAKEAKSLIGDYIKTGQAFTNTQLEKERQVAKTAKAIESAEKASAKERAKNDKQLWAEVETSRKKNEALHKQTNSAILSNERAIHRARQNEQKQTVNNTLKTLSEMQAKSIPIAKNTSSVFRDTLTGSFFGFLGAQAVTYFVSALSSLPAKVSQIVGEAVKVSSDRMNALKGLESVASAKFINANDAVNAVKNLRLVRAGIVSLGEASTSLKNLLATGFSLDQSIKLLEAFSDSAAFGKQSALGFGEAIRGATEGIKNGNSILVDNAGITKNLSVILQEMGKSERDVMNITQDASVRQALYNGLLKEASLFTGDANKLTQTYTGSVSQLDMAYQNLYATGGNLVTNSKEMREANKILTEQIENYTNEIGNANSETARFAQDSIKSYAKVKAAGFALAGATIEAVKVASFSISALVTSGVTMTTALVEGTVGGFRYLFNELTRFTLTSYNLIADTLNKIAQAPGIGILFPSLAGSLNALALPKVEVPESRSVSDYMPITKLYYDMTKYFMSGIESSGKKFVNYVKEADQIFNRIDKAGAPNASERKNAFSRAYLDENGKLINPAKTPTGTTSGDGEGGRGKKGRVKAGEKIDQLLPERGYGFTTYSRGANDQFATRQTVENIKELAQAWATFSNAPIQIGDIAKKGGGRLAGHATHNTGDMADIRPFRRDGRLLPTNISDPSYDRETTRQFVLLIKKMLPNANVLFNDPVLIKEGLTRYAKGHDNHLHVNRLGSEMRQGAKDEKDFERYTADRSKEATEAERQKLLEFALKFHQQMGLMPSPELIEEFTKLAQKDAEKIGVAQPSKADIANRFRNASLPDRIAAGDTVLGTSVISPQEVENARQYTEIMSELDEQIFNLTERTQVDIWTRKLLTEEYKKLDEAAKEFILTRAKEIDAGKKAEEQREKDKKDLEDFREKQKDLFDDVTYFFEDKLRALTEGGFKGLFRSIFDDLKAFLVRAGAELLASKFFKFLTGQNIGTGQQGGGLFGGNQGGGIFSLLGGNGGGFGGILRSLPLIGGLFGGASAATAGAGVAATSTGALGSLGSIFGAAGGVASGTAAGILGGGGAAAGTATAGAAGGSSALGPLGAFLTNPWTIGIAGAALGAFGLYKLFSRGKDLKKLKAAASSEFGVDVKDKNLLKTLRSTAQAYGIKVKDDASAKQAVRLEENEEVLREYAERTGQKTDKFDRKNFSDPEWSGNQFSTEMSSGGSSFSSGSTSTSRPMNTSGRQQSGGMMGVLSDLQTTVQMLAEKIQPISATTVVAMGANGASKEITNAVGNEFDANPISRDEFTRKWGFA